MTSAATPREGPDPPSGRTEPVGGAPTTPSPGVAEPHLPCGGVDGPAVSDANRLAVDRELFAELHSKQFEGGGWEQFRVEVIRYVVDVLQGWAVRGELGRQIARRIPRFRLTADECTDLASDEHHRASIVEFAAVEALESFRRKALEGKGWDPQRGASMRTYVTTGAVYAVVNQLNDLRAQHNRDKDDYYAGIDLIVLLGPAARDAKDPAERLAEADVLNEYMQTLDPLDRNIVWGRVSGLTYREIADMLETDVTDRGVERRWRRLKNNHDWIRRLDEKADNDERAGR